MIYIEETETCHGFGIYIDEDGDFNMNSDTVEVGFVFSPEQAAVVLPLLQHYVETGELTK